jgi:hypothetical protein
MHGKKPWSVPALPPGHSFTNLGRSSEGQGHSQAHVHLSKYQESSGLDSETKMRCAIRRSRTKSIDAHEPAASLPALARCPVCSVNLRTRTCWSVISAHQEGRAAGASTALASVGLHFGLDCTLLLAGSAAFHVPNVPSPGLDWEKISNRWIVPLSSYLTNIVQSWTN